MQVHPSSGVKPISDFRKHSAGILKQLKERGEPILLTQRGRSVAVLLDVETYQRLEEAARLRAAYLRGVEDLDRGRSTPHAEVVRAVKAQTAG